MKKIILFLFTIISFFGFYSFLNADSLVSSSTPFYYLSNYKQNGLINPGFYGVTPSNYVYNLSVSSGATLVSPTYSSGSTNRQCNTSIMNRFDYYNGAYSYYISNSYCGDAGTFIINYVNNITQKLYTWGIDYTTPITYYGTIKVFSYDNKIFFGGVYDNNYYSIYSNEDGYTYEKMTTTSISNPISIYTSSSQYIIIPNNSIATCSLNSNTLNGYMWSGFSSNHQSYTVPSIFGKSFGTSCRLSYEYLNNNFGLSTIVDDIGYSQYFAGGTFYSSIAGKYITSVFGSGSDTYSYTLDVPNNDNINFFLKAGISFTSGYIFNNSSYILYGKDNNISNIYLNDGFTNPLDVNSSSGRVINSVNNNPITNSNNIENNNYNNINVTITGSTTNVNIPGTCSFGKKLNPVYYNSKWWCQVDDNTYTCPYASPTPSLIYDQYFCEVQHENNGNDNSFLSGALESTGAISSPGSDDIGDYSDDNYQNSVGDTSSILGDIFSDLSNNPLNQLGEGISSNNFVYTLSGLSISSWSGTYTFSSSGGYIGTGTGGLKTGINCLLFDDNWNFLYKPSYSGKGLLSINLTNHGNWLDYMYYIPQKMFDVAVGPYNTFILFMSFFEPLNDNSNVCYFGQVLNIKYQRVFYGVGDGISNIDYLNNTPDLGTKTILDYIAIFILFILIFISIFVILFLD